VLLRPLPYAQEQRLMLAWESSAERPLSVTSPANFRDWRQARSFSGLAAFTNVTFALTGEGTPVQVRGASVSSNFFEVLGVRPQLGSTFTPAPDGVRDARTVVLGHALWQQRLGADPAIVGKSLRLNDASYTVLGVMPAGFEWAAITPSGASAADGAQLWTPAPHHDVPQLGADAQRDVSAARDVGYLRVVGRLAPGVSQAQAAAEMRALGERLAREYPQYNTGTSVRVLPLREHLFGSVRPLLLVLLGAVGLVLAIACANVANLFLARATTRQRELAVRMALGAARSRLVRQLLTESLLLALLAGVGGALLATWGVDVLLALEPADVPRLGAVSLDGRVLAFTLGISLLTGLVFGLLPALQASDLDVHGALKAGSSRVAAGRSRGALVVGEVALALVLLIAAGLLLESLWRLQRVDPGFGTERLLAFGVQLPRGKYPQEAQQVAFFQQVQQRLAALPGVERAGGVLTLPFDGDNVGLQLDIEGAPPAAPGEQRGLGYQLATESYLQTLGIPLRRGRGFGAADARPDAEPVALLSESAARRHWPGRDPLGARIRLGGEGNPWRRVVGVVGDVRHAGLTQEPREEAYVPLGQDSWGFLQFAVRTRGEPLALAGAVRQAVLEVDPEQPIGSVKTLEGLVAASVARQRFLSVLLGVFAAVALLLAGVGLYGVISYTAQQRTREIGIRMALGARSADVLRLVVGSGMRVALAGVGLGLGAAWGATRLLESQLHGVSATDPLTFALLALLVCGVALLATWLPARRATRVDPQVALRAE
ncbi:MAG TPA: ABC transporter permease, partial [Aggregicoccus sp.]|nr:ABC transporter permease [Aggregicoccus sp.]